MKLATYSAGGAESIGAVIADDAIIVDLAAADRALAQSENREAHPFFTDMLALLDAGSEGQSAAQQAAADAEKRLNSTPDGETNFADQRRQIERASAQSAQIILPGGQLSGSH